ncbi:hypothetical protein [Paenibacillus protaetiae]|uniref:Uncharacterized protein n=1 Tax=Paenibacillus protaetiae TaxID=2509456 RepID=A0A4P6EW79_9BACL|nr:hypothetical protein [Paenibacillus protaetiae]QAY66845.1 hypothetical protein ET464_11025 [Paenibacillus protaetiae]
MASSGEFQVITSGDLFPTASVPFATSNIVGANITFSNLAPTNIVLAPGRYLVNYSVSAWNMKPFNGVSQCKMMLFLNGLFLSESFAGGPEVNGASHASGNCIFSVTVPNSILQLRVDQLGGIVGPFSDISLSVSEITP